MHKGVKMVKKLNLSLSGIIFKISSHKGSTLHKNELKVTLELKTRTIFFQHTWIMSIYKFHLIKSRYVLIMSKHSTAAAIYTMHITEK